MITTHVLDTTSGRPAVGIPVALEHSVRAHEWRAIGRGVTDADGRLRSLVPQDTSLEAGLYRLIFDTRTYFDVLGIEAFYPYVVIVFETMPGEPHYHVPLLLSPYGYSTYRGS
jgi:5-hydroxyisourate hydrolase